MEKKNTDTIWPKITDVKIGCNACIIRRGEIKMDIRNVNEKM